MPVQDTSRKAYHELKEEGKITPRQDLAFKTIREFYQEKGYWPTPKEVHAFLAVEQAHKLAQFEGPNLVKPRITELVADPEDDYPDLLEKEEESRQQEYIEHLLDDYDSKKAVPVKIKDYQATLSDRDGEAAELEDQDDGSGSETVPGQGGGDSDEEIEIPYKMDGGNTVDMGSPCEAIENTCDLESVVEMLEKHGLLEKYQEEIDAARIDSGSEEDDVDGDGLVEKDGEEFVLDPEGEPESEEDDGKTLMKDGEVIG